MAHSSANGNSRSSPTTVMAGLVPATPIIRHDAFSEPRSGRNVKQFYVYILASRPGGALYVGVTNDLVRRVYQHRQKMVPGHSKRFHIERLVYFEVYDSPELAIQREKYIKHWSRAWKTNLIGQMNPTWRDLYDDIAAP
jgi:putative endonuclease